MHISLSFHKKKEERWRECSRRHRMMLHFNIMEILRKNLCQGSAASRRQTTPLVPLPLVRSIWMWEKKCKKRESIGSVQHTKESDGSVAGKLSECMEKVGKWLWMEISDNLWESERINVYDKLDWRKFIYIYYSTPPPPSVSLNITLATVSFVCKVQIPVHCFSLIMHRHFNRIAISPHHTQRAHECMIYLQAIHSVPHIISHRQAQARWRASVLAAAAWAMDLWHPCPAHQETTGQITH